MKQILLALLATLCFLSLSWSTQAQPARRAHRGIIVADTGCVVRAMEPYGGSSEGCANYAQVVNLYKVEFPFARVYCMVIPTAVAFYCPDTARVWTDDEKVAIQHIHSQLLPGVKPVSLIPVLEAHVDEPIYARTDHHWMPLGAYYAAAELARVARLPFADLSHYDRHVIHDFVGTMYRFSHDQSIKNAPEDFVYYTPRDVSYETTAVVYTLSKNRQYVVRQSEPKTVDFFRDYPDGSAAAYSTFMGGDTNTTSITTSTKNGRRLMILKDSYGNALPGYLFGSFEEIHVVDCRYFKQNMREFVSEHGITDILFANNLIHASSPKTSQSYERYLDQ